MYTINKKLLYVIIFAIIICLGVVQYYSKSNPSTSLQSNLKVYSGEKFSFKYPSQYALSEKNGQVKITGVTLPEIDTAKCEKIDDAQGRAYCRNPENSISPNITIEFLTGDGEKSWKEYYDLAKQLQQTGTFNVSSLKFNVAYSYGEFGGSRSYAMFFRDGLLLASFEHKDKAGHNLFIKGDKYQLNENQQRALLEQILSTLEIKS